MHRKWWTLLAVCVATFMLLLDITIVNVALPDIQRDLNASLSGLQWVVDAYALTLAALLLTAGALADLFGRRLVFAIGVSIFTVASLLCGLSTTPLLLHLARGLQGVGGAGMFATSLALIAQEFQGPERGTAIAAWGATIGGAVAIGPLVGGVLTEGLGWQWIFFVNVPIGIGAVALALSRSGESRDPNAKGIDWAGLVSFSGALFALNFGLLRGNVEGWSSAPIVGSLVGAVVLLIVFAIAELRRARPMFDITLLRKPAFAGVSAGTFAIGAGMFAMFLYLTIYLQDVLDLSPLQAGLRFLPLTLFAFIVPLATRRVVSRIPARLVLGVGLALVSAGLLLMHGVSVDSDWTTLLAGFIVAGIGIGLSNPSIATTALGVVPPARSGMASGINNTFRLSGVATGIAALGAIFQSRIESHLAALDPGTTKGVADAVASGGPGAVAGEGGAQLVTAAREAFISGLNDILLVGTATLLAGALVAFALIRQRDFIALGPAQAGEPASDGQRESAPETA
jgi:EmrB/QacA subfamily drug resistance transporter